MLFRGRCFTELFSRPQTDRVVLRAGKAVCTLLPQYTELDRVLPSPVSVPALLAAPKAAAAAVSAAAAGRRQKMAGMANAPKGAVITASGRRAPEASDSFRAGTNGAGAESQRGSSEDEDDVGEPGPAQGRLAGVLGEVAAWWLGEPAGSPGGEARVLRLLDMGGAGSLGFAAGVIFGAAAVYSMTARASSQLKPS